MKLLVILEKSGSGVCQAKGPGKGTALTVVPFFLCFGRSAKKEIFKFH